MSDNVNISISYGYVYNHLFLLLVLFLGIPVIFNRIADAQYETMLYTLYRESLDDILLFKTSLIFLSPSGCDL